MSAMREASHVSDYIPTYCTLEVTVLLVSALVAGTQIQFGSS